MGDCQKLWSLFRYLNIRCRIIIGTRKGTIILTTTHMHTDDDHRDCDCDGYHSFDQLQDIAHSGSCRVKFRRVNEFAAAFSSGPRKLDFLSTVSQLLAWSLACEHRCPD